MCGTPFSFLESEKQSLSIVSLLCGWDHPLSLRHSSLRCKIVPLEARGQHTTAYRTPLAHHLFYIGYKLKIIFYIFKWWQLSKQEYFCYIKIRWNYFLFINNFIGTQPDSFLFNMSVASFMSNNKPECLWQRLNDPQVVTLWFITENSLLTFLTFKPGLTCGTVNHFGISQQFYWAGISILGATVREM